MWLRTIHILSGALIQDKDQVPNAELGAFWEMLPERYPRVINFVGECRGYPFWPDRVRKLTRGLTPNGIFI